MMFLRSLVLALGLVCALFFEQVQAFDSTEIRLLEWPRGKGFTKRSDILDLGVVGPLARFRRKFGSDEMSRAIRNNQDFVMKDPIIRFGKRSGGRTSRAFRLLTPDF